MKFRIITALALLLLAGVSQAADVAGEVAALQHDWAIANYELNGDAQDKAFEDLIARAGAAVDSNPTSPDILIWEGIIKSSYAGIKGGLGALSLAKQARKSLEKAMKMDDRALDGSAYTSLGTLYANVPGWPVGFGSDKKAVQFLARALEINPDGIDTNYFYADYLLQKKDFEKAEQYFLKAQQAAPRANRPVADAGRQQQIGAGLAQVRSKLNKSGS